MTRRDHTTFIADHTTKGAKVNAEQGPKPTSTSKVGFFTTLFALLCGGGSGALSPDRVQGTSSTPSLARLALLTALASFASLTALALPGAASAATPCKTNPAQQCSPWWSLNLNTRPASISSGGEGTIVAVATNLGDAPTSGPITISVPLPPGAAVVETEGVPQVSFFAFPFSGGGFNLSGVPGACETTTESVTCTTAGPIEEFLFQSLNPYEFLEIRVKVEGVASGSEYAAEVSGGGAPPLSRHRPLQVGAAPAFGAEDLALVPEAAGGGIATHAGSHPFQLTATFNLNQTAQPGHPPALPKDLSFRLPPGQLGNATALPKCTTAQFATVSSSGTNLCPAATALGAADITVFEPANLGLRTFPVPVFNLEPKRGEPARFGFEVAQTPVILDTSVRSGKAGTPNGDYGVNVSVANISQVANFLASTLTFWGVPGDSRHDESRGWGCLAGNYGEDAEPCNPAAQSAPPAFLTLPTDCASPFGISVEGVSWPNQANPEGATLAPLSYSLHDGAGNPLGLTGCNQLPFSPQIEAEPTSNAATSPTGFNFEINVDDQGLTSAEGFAQSQIKKALVTLPQGFTTNPSVAEGLHACTLAQYEAEEVGFGADPGSGCPEDSKVGEVEIESPLVEQKVLGSLFVAKQGENPNDNNLLTIYLVAKNPEIGVLVKQALKVTPDPVTGQLTTEVDNIPQLPFSHFRLSFRQGQRSPLITPPTCGTYTVKALLYPWSNPAVPAPEEKSFQITQGPEGGPCPNGVPPFHPNLEAGTLNNAAGTYSPFVTKITRKDSEQEITHFSIKLPPGVIGKLAGVSSCSDAAIAAAKAREHEGGGTEEEQSPSCPKNSEVGHSLVGSGVGNVLAYAPGKLYLAGPYHGSNLSIVSITAAKVGPFDLGTVVVRFALRINPETAEVFVDSQGSDPIPHIVDGIPVHLRDIRAYVSRPEFTLNPTSCAKKSTASTLLGSGLNFASEADDQPVTVTSPFQAADCASLGFAPKLGLSLKGGTKRGGTPAFKAVVNFPKGSYANTARSVVVLPHSEFLANAHIRTVCTRVQFNAGAGNGSQCPSGSVYGRARAITPLLDEPLEGPVYLRSSEHKLPDLVAALHNKQVDFDLDGRIDSVNNGQIRNTFESVPDAPVSKFVLEMQGGSKGLLENSTDLCASKHRATSEFTGQNGKVYDTRPVLQAKCGKGKKGKKHGKH